jgi:putative aminopeptidase FrvX
MKLTNPELLGNVTAIPTMSFREDGVATFVRFYAMALDLKIKADRFGNVLVWRGSKPGGITFTAHMDHPGFEVVSSKGNAATIALWGKVDPAMCEGAKAVFYTAEGPVNVRLGKRTKGQTYFKRPLFTLQTKAGLDKGDFGHFDLPAFRVKGDRIETRAADNLMGVSAILDMFTRMGTKAKNVCGLFTRGEEAGFLGAFGAMETGLIPKEAPLIVLECSSARHAKVGIGDGPVIRVGDWQSSYDPAIDRWMSDTAEAVFKKEGKGFRFQRELLPGGRCEACVYIAEGYRTGGIALPLGNYHNQGPRGPAVEYVSTGDYENMVTLMVALARAKKPNHSFLRTQVKPIRKNYNKLKKKLIS